jgi:tight adherence protein B
MKTGSSIWKKGGELMLIFFVLCFWALTTFFLFYIILRNVFKDTLDLSRRLKKLHMKETDGISFKKLRTRKKGNFPAIPQKRLEKLEGELYAASIKLRAQEFITLWFSSAVILPGLVVFFGGNLIAAMALLIIAAAAPITAVKLIKRKRLSKLDGQLVDAISIICGALKAGFGFQKALESVAQEMQDPISHEFGRVVRECSLGMPMEMSFAHLIERTRNKDLEMICSAVLIQRQVGGNLAEVLTNVADTIRQRIKIKGDIKVLTAAGRISGLIIGLLPVFVMLILMLMNPEYMEIFFTTRIGLMMLGAAVILEAIGFYLVNRIISFKI